MREAFILDSSVDYPGKATKPSKKQCVIEHHAVTRRVSAFSSMDAARLADAQPLR
jgi:hypothetical protein